MKLIDVDILMPAPPPPLPLLKMGVKVTTVGGSEVPFV